MATKRRSGEVQRDTFDLSLDDPALLDPIQSVLIPEPSLAPLVEITDGRTWSPPGYSQTAPMSVSGAPVGFQKKLPPSGLPAPNKQSFADARQAVVCVRRKQRREVLFAKRRTGRGARSRKRFNQWSDVGCNNG